jgi:hypothetical protein
MFISVAAGTTYPPQKNKNPLVYDLWIQVQVSQCTYE